MKSQEVQLKLEHVTVFQSSAMFKLKGQVHCSIGENAIVLNNLSRKLDKSSIRVKGQGPGKIVFINVEKKYSEESTQERLKGLYSEREELLKSKKKLDDEYQDEEIRKDKIKLAQDTFAREFPKWYSLGKISIEAVKNMNTLFKEQTQELSRDIRHLEREITQIQNKINELDHKIAELGGSGQREIDSYYCISIKLDAEKESKFNLEVSCMITDAWWTPFYDIVIKDTNVEINLMADIYNQTGVDWDDVRLDISTASSQPVKMEKPHPYNIDHNLPVHFNQKQRFAGGFGKKREESKGMDFIAQNNVYFESSGQVRADEDRTITAPYEPEPEPEPEIGTIETDLSSSLGVQVYSLPTTFTIISDKNPKPLLLFQEELPSIRQYFWSASSPDRVLCNDKIRNKKHLILPGSAKVFVHEEFIGETRLDLIAPFQEFKLGERISYDIKIKKVMLAKNKQKEGVLKGKNSVSYKYELTIENLNQVKEELILYERIPHSVSEKIKVRLINFSDKYVNNIMNILKFVLDMDKIKDKKVISYEYEVISEKNIGIYPPLP